MYFGIEYFNLSLQILKQYQQMILWPGGNLYTTQHAWEIHMASILDESADVHLATNSRP